MEKKRMSTSPQRIYNNARYAILGLILFTVLNVLLALVDSDSYYVVSVFLAYFLYLGLEGVPGILVAAVILVPYALCFFLSTKKPLWMIVALVLVALDTVILILLALANDALLGVILDIIVHIAEIVLLVLAIKAGKSLFGKTAEADPYHPAEGGEHVPGRVVNPESGEGPFTDVVVVVALSEDGTKFGLQSEGLARFYDEELALGTKDLTKSMLLGSAFTSSEERLRVPYTDVVKAFYTKKNQRTVRIDFADGRAACFTTNWGNKQQLLDLLAAHGITVEPFVQQ